MEDGYQIGMMGFNNLGLERLWQTSAVSYLLRDYGSGHPVSITIIKKENK